MSMHTSPVMHVPSAHRTLCKLINRQTDRCGWFTTCIHLNIEIEVIGMTSAAYHYPLQVTMKYKSIFTKLSIKQGVT